MKRNLYYLLIALFAFCSCAEVGEVSTGLLMTGTETNNMVKFAINALPSSYSVSVTSTKKVETDVDITIAVDTTLVDAYNTKNGSAFFGIPEGACELSVTKLKIPAGKSISTAATVAIVDDSKFLDGRTYVVPVTIRQTSGDQDIIESGRTIFLKISRTLYFNSITTQNVKMTHQFIIDKPVTEMPVYTWEVKVFCNFLKFDSSAFYRLCGFGGDANCSHGYNVTEDLTCDQNLIRMEGNAEGQIKLRLNVNGGGGNYAEIVSATNFQEKRWYSVAVVNDGSTLTLYIDGEKDSFTPMNAGNYPIYGLQIGMPWNGYQRSQHWNGRLSEMRIWNKPLTPRDIRSNMCGVDASSEGLIGYWKMNEGEGSTLYDATAAQNHLEYKDGTIVGWLVGDDENKCVE